MPIFANILFYVFYFHLFYLLIIIYLFMYFIIYIKLEPYKFKLLVTNLYVLDTFQ